MHIMESIQTQDSSEWLLGQRSAITVRQVRNENLQSLIAISGDRRFANRNYKSAMADGRLPILGHHVLYLFWDLSSQDLGIHSPHDVSTLQPTAATHTCARHNRRLTSRGSGDSVRPKL